MNVSFYSKYICFSGILAILKDDSLLSASMSNWIQKKFELVIVTSCSFFYKIESRMEKIYLILK